MVSRIFWPSVVLAAVILAFTPADVGAGTPVLDPNFGTSGVALYDINPGGFDRAMALDVQPDGKIVATGEASGFDDLTVVRFNTDGSIDMGFADDGAFITDLVRRGEDIEVAAGGAIYATGSNDLHIVKLNPDGTPDASFGADGISGSQFFNPDDPDETQFPNMYRVLPWPGNRVLVGGTVDYGPYFFTFALYNADGTLVSSFGDDGQVQTDFAPSPDDFFDQEPLALVSYPGDRFVAAGYRDVADFAPAASVIARYSAEGELDLSFGDDGKTTNDFFADHEQVEEVLVLSDGRVLAIGWGRTDQTANFDDQLFIARYDADGSLNDAFGTNGVVIHDRPGQQEVTAAGLAPDGSIIVAGRYDDGGTKPFLARFDENGNADPDFGDNGWLVLDIPGFTNPNLEDLTFDEHGNILVAGSVTQGTETMHAVFKFGTAGSGDERTWGDWNCSASADPVDSLLNLRHDAGLGTNTGDCPDMGTPVTLLIASALTWGDADCNGTRDPVDSLKLLRHDAGLSVSQDDGCPALGSDVLISPD